MSVLTGPSGFVANLRIADRSLSRLRGLIGSSELANDEGLLIRPCRQVHTFGMRYPIDAVFCGGDGVVLAVFTLRPRTISRLVRRARFCIELRSGRAEGCGITVGTRLEIS
jgi:uncharacterized membrane protein (UPF0127 family)